MLKSNISLIVGFTFFGLLIGVITGITSAEISNTILTAMFAFIGGKLLMKLEFKDAKNQLKIGLVVSFFSFFCIIGLLSGIYIKTNYVLHKNIPVNLGGQAQKDSEAYLRSLSNTDIIELKYRRGEISADSTLDLIFKLKSNEKIDR